MQRPRLCHATVTLAALTLSFASFRAAPVEAQEGAASITSASRHGVVAADHAEASRVGAELLEKGGNAVDAAIGSLLTLGVVNPFASGLGGGGFCVVRHDGEVGVLDFRETAPGKAHRDMYVRDGKAEIPLSLWGGLAVAVPGEPMGLQELHEKYGAVEWGAVVEPARRLATDGFVVGELLPRRLERMKERLDGVPALADEFKIDGAWVTEGQTLRRPELGRALKRLAEDGAAPFYEGPIAAAIVESVTEAGGVFTASDLSGYQVTWRTPLVGEYRGHVLYTMPPPSSGGTAILTALNILERYDLRTLGQSTESLHRIAEALKHAFADRARWLGDADFVEVPVETLTSKERARELRVLPDGVLKRDDYGMAAPPPDDSGTTHVSVIDGAGNMAACTSTINTSFGSLVFVEDWGLILNNEMADFTAQPGVANNYGLVGTEQNAVAPGKRPLSSMSPTLVTRDGEPFMAVGGSGGPTIITGTFLALIRVIDWKTSPAEAVTLPRLHHQWMPHVLFVEAIDDAAEATLEARGHDVEIRNAYNAVQLVVRRADGTLVGVSDPNKSGRPAAATK